MPQLKYNINNSKVCSVLCFCGFLDLFGVSMIMPLILPQARDLGASPVLAGILGSTYGALQLISSPVVGKWSDSAGRYHSLVLCLFLAACGYTILGVYTSLTVFFLGRFISGCFKHSQTISKAFLADVVSSSDHAAILGNFNSFSSIGFILGPIIGGHLAEIDFSLVAYAAGFAFAGNAVLMWWFLPNDMKEEHIHHVDMETSIRRDNTSLKTMGSDEVNFSFNHFINSFRDFNWIELWDLFLIKFLSGFSVIIFRTNFTLVLKQKFEASPTTIGYLTSYSGVVATLSGFVIGRITDRYNNTAKMFLHITVLQMLTLLCLTLSPNIPLLVIFLMPLNIVTSLSRVSGMTLTIERSGKSAVGSIMGLSQSVMSFARMIAPFLAGLAQEFSVVAASYLSVLAAFASVFIMLLRPQDPAIRQKKEL